MSLFRIALILLWIVLSITIPDPSLEIIIMFPLSAIPDAAARGLWTEATRIFILPAWKFSVLTCKVISPSSGILVPSAVRYFIGVAGPVRVYDFAYIDGTTLTAEPLSKVISNASCSYSLLFFDSSSNAQMLNP